MTLKNSGVMIPKNQGLGGVMTLENHTLAVTQRARARL